MPPSSSLSSPTVSESMEEANYKYDDEPTTMNKTYSGDDSVLPPLSGAGETRKVQPEEVAIVSFILGRTASILLLIRQNDAEFLKNPEYNPIKLVTL